MSYSRSGRKWIELLPRREYVLVNVMSSYYYFVGLGECGLVRSIVFRNRGTIKLGIGFYEGFL